MVLRGKFYQFSNDLIYSKAWFTKYATEASAWITILPRIYRIPLKPFCVWCWYNATLNISSQIAQQHCNRIIGERFFVLFCSASLEFHLVITKLSLTENNGVLSSGRSVHLPEFKFDKCWSDTMSKEIRVSANSYQKCYLLNCIVFQFWLKSFKNLIDSLGHLNQLHIRIPKVEMIYQWFFTRQVKLLCNKLIFAHWTEESRWDWKVERWTRKATDHRMIHTQLLYTPYCDD